MADFDTSALDSLPAASFTPSTFAQTYLPVAQRIADKTGIDANTVLGQMGLETGWGKSIIPGTNNLTNIKDFSGGGASAVDNQTGTTDKYRQFSSLDDYADHYSDLLSRKYKGALNTGVDANATAKALKAGGFAEDANYVPKVIAATKQVAQARGLAPVDPASGGGSIIGSANAASFDPSSIDSLPDMSAAIDALPDQTAPQKGFWQSAGDSLSDAVHHPLDAARSALVGIGGGVSSAGLGLASLASRIVGADGVNQFAQGQQNDIKNILATQPNQGLAKTGDVLGQAAPAMLLPGGILAQGAGNALLGAGQASVNGGDTKDILGGGLLGGAAGAGGAAAGKALGGLIGGVGGKEVQQLRDIGVSPTLGQTLGGVANKVEQRLTSVPLYGDAIAAGRQNAVEQFNKGVVNDALSPIGATVGKSVDAGADTVAAATQKLSDAWDNVLPQATFAADAPFMSSVQAARQDLVNFGSPPGLLARFDSLVDNSFLNRVGQNGTTPGTVYQRGESVLNKFVRETNKSVGASADDRALAQSLSNVIDAARDSLQRNSAQGVGQQLANVRQAYAKFKTVEAAAGSSAGGQTNSIFTPQAFNRAVKSNVSQGTRARGQAFGQDLSEAGVNRLGSTVPDSGTAGRIANTTGLGALGATAITNPLAAVGYAGGAGLTHLLYTDAGRRILSGLLSARGAWAQTVGGLIGNNAAIPGGLLGAYINSKGQ